MISVILPVYQVEKYIVNCLKSIVDQSYKHFELIIVNDGTKDNSIVLANNFLKDTGVNYKIINQKNSGVSSARNRGIKNSKGNWVICIDPDDVINKDFLKNLIEVNLQNETKVSIGSYQKVTEETIFKKAITPFAHSIYNQSDILNKFLLRRIKIISPAILVQKKLILENDIWFSEDMRFSEDVHWIWRLLFNINKVSYIHKEIYNYNARPNSTMTSSGIDKIMTGYYGFKDLDAKITEKSGISKEIIFDRWVFGALRASTKMINLEDFKELSKRMSYENHVQRLLKFPDYRVRIISALLKNNIQLFHFLGKII